MQTTDPDRQQNSFETSRSGRRRWRWAALLAVLAAAGLGLAAWRGGSPKASSNPSNSTVAGCSSSGCSSSAASARLEADALKYAECMRSHGLTNFPDPTVGSNGLPTFNIHASANNNLSPQSPQYQAAQRACRGNLPDLGGNTSAAKEADALKYSQCMRSHGEPDFPDPNGQGVIQIPNATGILAENSPQYKEAQQACQTLDHGLEVQGSSRSGNGS